MYSVRPNVQRGAYPLVTEVTSFDDAYISKNIHLPMRLAFDTLKKQQKRVQWATGGATRGLTH